MSKETGGQAFPHENHLSHRGMTLRDYFAAKAMQGLLKELGWNDDSLAKQSYEVADSMLKARKQ